MGIVGLYRNGTQAWSIAPAFALRFEARERPHNTDVTLAAIAAKRLPEDLDETY